MSLLDYDDKISIVLFISGCNYRCPYCHNSYLMEDSSLVPELKWDDIMDHLKSRTKMVDAVVFSGGEPTLLPNLKERIKEVKDLGYLVKLDTNGTNPKLLKELIDEKLIDYVAMDIKNSISNYFVTAGVKNPLTDNVLKSIDILKSSDIDYEFRTTLLKEHHDYLNIENIGKTLKGAKKLFLQKYVYRESVLDSSLHEVPLEMAEEFVNILLKYISKVELRGY